MTYDWVRVWWEFYGGGAELRLFVFFAGQSIEAVVPIYIDALSWGPLRFREAQFSVLTTLVTDAGVAQ